MPHKEKKDEDAEQSGSEHPSLDKLTAQVEERYREQQVRNNERITKTQVEKEHAQYLRSTYGTNTSQQASLFGPDYPSSQSTRHGLHTIGLDARVNLGKAVFGMPTTSSSSSSIESTSQPPKHTHSTALSLVERLGQQYQANQRARNQAETVVIDDDDDNAATRSKAQETKKTSSTAVTSMTSTALTSMSSAAVSSMLSTAVTSSPSSSQSTRCPVMNCEVSMKNRTELDEHMEASHSPCNPCRHLRSGQLWPTLEEFVCPVCLGRFPSHQLCLEHMVSTDHKALMNPVALAAYACPQCLLLFPSQRLCVEHMQEARHNTYSYAFRDDEGCRDAQPVPMPPSVVQELITHCRQVPWRLECISCEKKIDMTVRGGRTQIAQHLRYDHTLMATTDLTPGEVFGLYMIKAYTCIQCLRLFTSLPAGDIDAVHECRRGVMGMFVEATSDCKSFEQYIIRYALGPVKEPTSGSRENVFFNEAGTSKDNTLSNKGSKENILSNEAGGSKENVLSSKSSSHSNPQPAEGGVYVSPRSTSQSTLQSMTSGSGPLTTIDFRNSVPAPQTGYQYDSDNVLAHSVSSSALLTKGKKRSKSRFSSSSDLLGVAGSSSATLDSNHNEPHPTTASSSAGSITSSESFVTCVSYPGKRSAPEQGGSNTKRRRHSSSTSSESMEQVEITSSMENLSVAGTKYELEENLSKGQTRRQRRRHRQKEKRQLASSESSNSVEDWLKVNPISPTSNLFNPKKKTKTDKNAFNNNSPGTSNCDTVSSDLGLSQLFSSSTEGRGWERDGRQVKLSPVAATTSRPALIVDIPAAAIGCQTSGSLKALSPNKCIQTSSSLVGVDPGPSLGVLSPAPNIPQGLDSMRHIVFLDMDNWGGFWSKLPCRLPDRTFVWGFYGGRTQWNEPYCEQFRYAKNNGLWHVHNKCSNRKDAADFAICLMVGKLDERLPKHIPFTILSGDHGFLELENQMRGSRRRATVINPHHRSNVEVYALICSVGDV